MAFDPVRTKKKQGDLLASADWNDLVDEAKRLGDVKVNRAGDTIGGPLTVAGALSVGAAAPAGVSAHIGSSDAVQLRLTQARNEEWARLSLNANGNEYVLSVGGPGSGTPNTFNVYSASAARNVVQVSATGLTVHGALNVAGSDIYFTQTDHNHTGAGNAVGHAAIENAADYGALMILGRSVSTGGSSIQRRVRLWDVLEVNGNLQVMGSMLFPSLGQPIIHINPSGTGNPERALFAHSPSFTDWGQFYRDSDDKMIFKGSGNPVLTVALGGRTVGVNTDNPETALHVMGDAIRLQSGGKRIQIRATGSAVDIDSLDTDLFINNNDRITYIRNYRAGSSRELKERISSLELDEALEALEALEPVHFAFKDSSTHEMQLGFIAEDVPELLRTSDAKSIRPMDFIALLTRVVQEQQRQIAALRAGLAGPQLT